MIDDKKICQVIVVLEFWIFEIFFVFLQVKGVEYDVIVEGIKQNGEEDTDKVVKVVLVKRYVQVSWFFVRIE